MSDRDIGKYLDYSELELIATDPDDVDYDNLLEEEKARYRTASLEMHGLKS